mgnify:FL=1
MTFKDTFNKLLKELNCTSRKLSINSGISESVISRYRSGERTPKKDSTQINKLIDTLYNISHEQELKYTKEDIKNILLSTLQEGNSFDYETLSKNLNNLIITLNININDLSKYIVFDSSHISRIRYGKTKPSDPISFSNKIATYIVLKYNDSDNIKRLSLLINNNITSNTLFDQIFTYLTSNNNSNNNEDNHINDFLNNLNNFDLNDYIKAIKFDQLKVPTIPFYKARTKNYYELEEMKQAEIDFLKATVLSKSKEDIFMCSDMPMEDMAKDIEFGKKWMFGIAMCLKKGLHLNIIHNLDRPFNEMMLGLESWIPIYMTGQVSPYYFKESKNNIYGHLNYTSGNYALYGECIKGYHDKGKYYLTSNSKEIEYYKNKTNYLLKKATPLMEIYTEKDKDLYQTFLLNDSKIKSNRQKTLNTLPLFTINDKLLDKILKRNKISKENIIKIKKYKQDEENYVNNILKNNIITDTIYNYENEFTNNLSLSLENIFYNQKITYTYHEYLEHLKDTINYSNKNYHVIINNDQTFKNISINIVDNNYVIISKSINPTIHFVIRHPKLKSAIENFKPIVKE